MSSQDRQSQNAAGDESLELNKETLQDLDLDQGFGAEVKGGGAILTAASGSALSVAVPTGNTTISNTCANAIITRTTR